MKHRIPQSYNTTRQLPTYTCYSYPIHLGGGILRHSLHNDIKNSKLAASHHPGHELSLAREPANLSYHMASLNYITPQPLRTKPRLPRNTQASVCRRGVPYSHLPWLSLSKTVPTNGVTGAHAGTPLVFPHVCGGRIFDWCSGKRMGGTGASHGGSELADLLRDIVRAFFVRVFSG